MSIYTQLERERERESSILSVANYVTVKKRGTFLPRLGYNLMLFGELILAANGPAILTIIIIIILSSSSSSNVNSSSGNT